MEGLATAHATARRDADHSPAPGARARWEARTVWAALAIDTGAVTLSLVAAYVASDRPFDEIAARDADTLGPIVAVVFVVALWFVALVFTGAYDVRTLGAGSEQYRRVAVAGLRVLAMIAIAALVGGLDVDARAVVAFVVMAVAVDLVGRYVLSKRLQRSRARGRFTRRTLVVGTEDEAAELISHLRRAPYAGFEVVAACIGPAALGAPITGIDVAVVGGPDDVLEVIGPAGVDTVAVAGSRGMSSDALRRLAWRLEGSGVDLVVAPAITDVAGPRISVQPVGGLPLLFVDEPELSGAQRLLKAAFDRVAAAALLVLLAPLFAGIALAVRLGGRPVVFRQTRIGQDGRPFVIRKFRTMVTDAEAQLAGLTARNDGDGFLFKLREDPRVTTVGRWLRRHSLDELPQLWNVFTGSMSIVGPRPPLPSEVARYGTDAHRRLLVKPGLTGLWQVSGRSELSWEESVRLDLFYVENWSPALDAQILWRTVPAVVRGRGAY
jgi:exopolysaccharide biosynthesis polyprenyl glycosylphosphotransferase